MNQFYQNSQSAYYYPNNVYQTPNLQYSSNLPSARDPSQERLDTLFNRQSRMLDKLSLERSDPYSPYSSSRYQQNDFTDTLRELQEYQRSMKNLMSKPKKKKTKIIFVPLPPIMNPQFVQPYSPISPNYTPRTLPRGSQSEAVSPYKRGVRRYGQHYYDEPVSYGFNSGEILKWRAPKIFIPKRVETIERLLGVSGILGPDEEKEEEKKEENNNNILDELSPLNKKKKKSSQKSAKSKSNKNMARKKEDVNISKQSNAERVARNHLKQVCWAMVYPDLLMKSVHEAVESKKRLLHGNMAERINNILELATSFIMANLEKQLIDFYSDPHPMNIAPDAEKGLLGMKKTLAEKDIISRGEILIKRLKDIIEGLKQITTEELMPSELLNVLASISGNLSVPPQNYFLDFELSRLHFTYYATLKNVTPIRTKMILSTFMIIRILIHKFLVSPWERFKKVKEGKELIK